MFIKKTKYIVILLYLVGFFEVLPIGFLGLMPLDQSMIFEGAGRIMRGEVPFQDFYLSHGLVPCYMQVFFFKVFGVHWYSYVIHASTVNGFFVLLVFYFLSNFHPDWKKWNIFLSIFSGWLFYPFIGTPYPENHAVFFGLLAVFFLLLSIRGKYGGLYLVFPCFFLSYFSKPIPAIFFLLSMAILVLFNPKCFFPKNIVTILIGLFVTSVIFIMLIGIGNFDNFLYYYVQLPSSMGLDRISNSGIILWILKIFYLLPLSIIFILLFLLYHVIENFHAILNGIFLYRAKEMICLSVSLILICVAFAALTNNQFMNSFGILFIAFGILFPYLVEHYQLPLTFKGAGILLFSIVSMTFMMDAVRFTKIIVQRNCNDMIFDYSNLHNYSKDLGLYYQIPDQCKIALPDLEKVLSFLRAQQEPFCYFGDLSILNTYLCNKSPFPSILFHYGLTVPPRGTKKFAEYRKVLENNIKNFRIKYLVIESEKSWMGVSVNDFFSKDVLSNQRTESFGNYVIINLH